MGPEELKKSLNDHRMSKKSVPAQTERTLTPDENSFLEMMLQKLPPVIARKEVKSFLGGLISPKLLSNADSAGLGPQGAFKVGTNVAYSTEGLTRWLIERGGVTHLINIKRI